MADHREYISSVENDHGLLAKPLHLQRLEKAVRLDPFLNYVQNYFKASEESGSGVNGETAPSNLYFDPEALKEGYKAAQEKCNEPSRLYNFSKVKKSRKWLKNILLSSDSSDDTADSTGTDDSAVTEEDLQDMLKLHKLRKAAQAEFQANPDLKQYQYYSAGVLSNCDKFYEHQKAVLGSKKKQKEKCPEKRKGKLKKGRSEDEKNSKCALDAYHGVKKREKGTKPGSSDRPAHRHSKKKNAASHEAVMNMKRRRLWIALCKKEINRAVKQNSAAHKEVLTTAKRLAQACQKEVRKTALLSQKVMKDVPSRARRLTKEMLLYWKRYEKVEKEHRKKAEKEAQEQLRMDIELREAKRQQRKLNFLITQTELYAHFMSRKMPGLQDAQEQQILSQLDEQKSSTPTPTFSFLQEPEDDYDSEEMKSIALRNAGEAYRAHVSQTSAFDASLPSEVKKEGIDSMEAFDGNLRLSNPTIKAEEEHPQPAMFVGKLKSYQLKGMNWLYSLYDKGINGILADEMGLGKTVQTIAFLATLIKVQGIWGPFLIIAPASTLHNWQQEFSKFVPKFKVLPYWGNTSDRKVLRKFWSQKDLHTEHASFHVLITSYQLVVQDVKYFQRIKWQYMVLDEAQAIKSTSSVRWKILLGFNCRNRLLLTGTPIQNSMAELWALLHFIMPTLFDSHEEFNEWFSKDIESHAENKTVIDEKHLSRLHKILQPFMLRRVKKDVENELSDKIEILMYCQLTQRQKVLYQGLKNKISIDDLMQTSSASSSQAQTATSSLLNLVMQFRKVCNHPDLFERREVKHPFFMKLDTYFLPKLLFREGLLHMNRAAVERLLLWKLGIFQQEYIHHALFPSKSHSQLYHSDCCFSFSRFIDLSPSEISDLVLNGLQSRWIAAYLAKKSAYRIQYRHFWESGKELRPVSSRKLLLSPLQPVFSLQVSNCAVPPLVFTDSDNVYSFLNYIVHPKAPSQTKLSNAAVSKDSKNPAARILECVLSKFPTFLTEVSCKVVAAPFAVYSPDPSAKWWLLRQELCGSPEVYHLIRYGHPKATRASHRHHAHYFHPLPAGGLSALHPPNGWSKIIIPNKETLVTDSGKLTVLDNLLNKLKAGGHRVLIYSQMTRMIDLLEEYMWHRKHTYMRLDGSSKISDRRDMVADFQARSDIFVFLLSTRAGGLGINLTAADTVIFYDSDWNPTVDQQAMDRAHRLGQTKQVTVYRLVCKGSIEERILQRAREKSEIQRMVISGGNFKPDTLKPKEVVSLLLDDDELERKFRLRQEERKQQEKASQERKKKMEHFGETKRGGKRKRLEENITIPAVQAPSSNQDADSIHSADSIPPSPYSEHSLSNAAAVQDENSSDGLLVVDDSSPSSTPLPFNLPLLGKPDGSKSSAVLSAQLKKRGTGRSRGRPRGSGKRGNGRGRGNLMATAAAELAGAQAGKSAAFAAYGFALPGGKSLQGSSPTVSSSTITRGPRGGIRGSGLAARALSGRGRGSSRGLPKGLASKTLSLGFYTPGSKS